MVGLCADRSAALEIAGRLTSGGFSALVLGRGDIETDERRFFVRRFRLGEEGLDAEDRKKQALTVSFSRIGLLLLVSRITTQISTETEKKRSFSLTRAVVSGGLVMTSEKKTVREVQKDSSERVLYLYSHGVKTVVFGESDLVYAETGLPLQLSAAANFTSLITELRKRSAGARFDDRLLSRAGQVRVLGPTLTPGEHIDIAVTLLARMFGQKLSEL